MLKQFTCPEKLGNTEFRLLRMYTPRDRVKALLKSDKDLEAMGKKSRRNMTM